MVVIFLFNLPSALLESHNFKVSTVENEEKLLDLELCGGDLWYSCRRENVWRAVFG